MITFLKIHHTNMKYILLSFFILFCLSVKSQDSTGNFTVKAPINVWQQLLEVIDRSDASNLVVQDLKKFIIAQLNAQVKKPEAKTEPPKKEGKKQ